MLYCLDRRQFTQVKRLLASGVDPNEACSNGWWAGLSVCKQSWGPALQEVLVELVKCGMKLSHPDQTEHASPPLTRALEMGHVDLAKWMIRAGANLLAENKDGVRAMDVVLYQYDKFLGAPLSVVSRNDLAIEMVSLGVSLEEERGQRKVGAASMLKVATDIKLLDLIFKDGTFDPLLAAYGSMKEKHEIEKILNKESDSPGEIRVNQVEGEPLAGYVKRSTPGL